MEQVGLVLDQGPLDLEDYHLDLDAGTEMDDFDFNLDGSYSGEGQYQAAEAGADDSTHQSADFEINHQGNEVEGGHSSSDNAHTPGSALGLGEDVGGHAGDDHQDEIGYEEEEHVTTDINAADQAEEISMVDLQPSTDQLEGQQDHTKNASEVQTQETLEIQIQETLDIEVPEHVEVQTQNSEAKPNEEDGQALDFEGSGAEPLDNGVDNDETGHDSAGVNDEGAHEGSAKDRASYSQEPEISQADEASNDASESSEGIPNITVFYNDGQYSLFGSSSDDPETYFLSDANVLDSPLSALLSSIRDVIFDEIPSQDELFIHIDELSLEFGESSQKRFLRRTFREILDCHTALATKQGADPSDLVLRLIVRPNCERHFAELLHEAGLDYESPSDGADDGSQSHEEMPQEDYSEEQMSDSEEPSNNESRADYGMDNADYPYVEESNVQTASGEGSHTLEGVGDQNPSLNRAESAERFEFEDEGEGEDALEESYDEIQYDEYNHPEGEAEGDEEYAEDEVDVTGGANDEFGADQATGDAHLATENSEQPAHEEDSHQDTADGPLSLDAGEDMTTGVDVGKNPELTSDGKFPPFLTSTDGGPPNNNPMASHSISDRGIAEDFIDYSEDEAPPPSVSEPRMKRAHDLPMRQPALKRRKAKDAKSELEWWQIDYSDDEYDDDTTITYHQGNDLAFALDTASGLAAIDDNNAGGDDEYVNTFDITEYSGELLDIEAVDLQQETSQTMDHGSESIIDVNYDQTAYSAAAQGATPTQSSATATLNGDEIGYEDDDAPAESLVNEDNTQHSGDAPENQNDEIDWGQDDDDNHESAEQDKAEAAPTPSSVSAKRSRQTDEPESLADEGDCKRRRT
ncbi:hypothetical protein QBC46DRAFT_342057 [Diplogelasinospora grovesii]|uniref:Uncharacterized protein n=1 Tax=Diplogelasinospora grovesii TaxID=303347 RepID=A0AAN6N7B6_9PEZI|nr:hypothetical protein QBC46DRAFT_342057 [Diplogelasinospora grovesii]